MNPEVTAEPSDVVKRLDSAADSLVGLWDLLDAEEPLTAVLARVAHSARRAIADVDAVTVTALSAGVPATLACTDDRYVRIDQRQYAADRGPCLEAVRSGRAVRAAVGDEPPGDGGEAWPEFDSAAREAGVLVCMSVPLIGQPVRPPDDPHGEPVEDELAGALNLFSASPAAFDPFDESLTRLFSIAAVQAIGNARRWQLSREQVRNLEIAMHSRAEIDQAKGIVMASRRCTAAQAFAELVEQSQRRNVKLREIAREMIDSVVAEPT